MAAKRVLSVGQCSADHGSISWMLRSNFDAEVTPAATAADALAELGRGGYDLVLVNRVFDSDGSSGVQFIEQIKAVDRLKNVPVMLVSNFDDAQQEAARRGALPGFGKNALRQPATLETLKKVLG